MAGKIGRSGRRPLSVEVERSKIRDAAWRVTGEFIESKEKLKDRAWLASGIVKADMAKPIVVDNSTHTHFTLDLSKLTPEQLHEISTGRKSVRDFATQH